MKKTRPRTNNPAGQGPWLFPRRRVIMLALGMLLLCGCAMWPAPTPSARIGTAGPLGSCADFFSLLDHRTAGADALDAGYFRVQHYPYLRTDRFLASFRDDVQDAKAFQAWIDRMQRLDQSARRIEIADLPDAEVAALAPADGREALYRQVATCGDLLKAADFSSAANKEKLRREVSAPDEYLSLRRILGLYPVTQIFVANGVRRWHETARKQFSTTPATNWHARRYRPLVSADRSAARRILRRTRRDALCIPLVASQDRQALFRMYAPMWVVQTQGRYDRIGAPRWSADARIDIDTHQPITYTHLSFTRFQKKILTQLNYVIWFPSRPGEGALDLYAGLLDGLNFRVTLDTRGDPLLYESIHNCGCYYKAYPTDRLQIRKVLDFAEPPLILKAPRIDPASQIMVVAMESRTHYVRHLYPLSRENPVEAKTYTLAEYGELQRLQVANGNRRSLFDRYGIVPATHRLERFILWPTGVLSPGAMRQWGRHAVAFVGKRQFDDPFYLDKMFISQDF